MVLDSSALLAILLGEPEAAAMEAAIEADPVRLVSAASVIEASMVIETRFGAEGGREFDRLLQVAGAQVVSVDGDQVEAAREAYRAFGKGRHRAGLNFGDCFVYALARVSGEPLLCKGDDFAHTDLPLVPC